MNIEAYKTWTPAAQAKALEKLRRSQNENWRPFYCQNPVCNGKPHEDWTWNHARKDQRPPKGDWLTWLMLSGRGSGKTRSGAEWVHRMTEKYPRCALIAPTGPDARDTMIEGQSGILAIAAPANRPVWEPSKRRLTWPNGAMALVFSAEEPDRLRGPEHYFAWVDEACFYPLVEDVWDNLLFGLRLGPRPKVCVTTTPKPRKWLKNLIADESTVVSKASTYDNLENLSPLFAEKIVRKYEGTRLGRQELQAEIIDDVVGALWSWSMIEDARITNVPTEFDRVVVGVDPSGSSSANSDETGIVVCGSIGDDFYVLDDRSGKYSPHGWAMATLNAYEDYSADAVVVETNFGGDMVKETLRASGLRAHLITVNAKRNKALRAEPIVGLYEQSRVHHVRNFIELEMQMCEYVPYDKRSKSPDRLDALVYSLIQLNHAGGVASVASPLRLVQ